LLANWERFLHEEKELDPLVRMAVGHYQFEAIHPFTDGNVRTGRVLNILFLINENLLTLPVLYLSRYLIQRKADYYRLLLAVTSEHAWEEWVLYVLKGVEETAKWTTAKIEAIRSLSAHTAEYARAMLPKIYSRELVDLVFELPYCRIQNRVAAKIAKRQSASVYLKQLVEIGVLEERVAGRKKLFIHPKLMELLTREDNCFVKYRQNRSNKAGDEFNVRLLLHLMGSCVTARAAPVRYAFATNDSRNQSTRHSSPYRAVTAVARRPAR
jgi:hypothetical protein